MKLNILAISILMKLNVLSSIWSLDNIFSLIDLLLFIISTYNTSLVTNV